MAACPSCGSFLVGGAACDFCGRYGVQPAQPDPWQPPPWTPQSYSTPQQYAGAASTAGSENLAINTGINLLELSWARTRVRWSAILFAAIGGLSIYAYWLITHYPETVAQLLIGFLLDPDQAGSASNRTTLDILQLIVIFILSWIPLSGSLLHVVMSGPSTMLSALAQAANLTPLLWQGALYLLLAVLIWRRSMIALTIATLLFLADSGIYTYAIARLFMQLWDLNQKFVEMYQNYPSLAPSNPYDIQHWPWGLVLPIVIRGAVLWFLAMSLSGMGILRLHHRRLKAARDEQATQAQAA
jgi:hypothetical protein